MCKTGTNQRRAGAVLSYINVIFKIVIGLVYTPIMLRLLGRNEYGVYSLCVSFMGYLTLLNAGINAAYIRFYVQAKTRKNKSISELNGTFLKIFLFIAVSAFVFGLIIIQNETKIFGSKITGSEYRIIQALLFIMTINSVCLILNCVFDSIIIANEKFIFGKAIGLLNTLMVPIVAIPLLLCGGNSVGVAIITCLVSALVLLLNAVFCIKKLKVHFDLKTRDKSQLKSIIVFSSFIVIQSIMDQLNWQIDKFLLARFSGSAEITIYTVGSQINSIYITIASAFTIVFIAQINQLVANEKERELSELFIRIARILCMIVMFIMIAYMVFGKQFIRLWAGNGYEDSFYVGLFLMLPITVSLTQGLGQDIMRAKNIHKLQMIINIVVCVLNLFISIPLCKHFGAVGGAAGTFIGEAFICVFVQYIYYEKVGHLNMRQYIIEMCKITPSFIVPISIGILINKLNLVSDIRTFILYGMLFTVAYIISVWLLGMNQYEKTIIKTGIKRIVGK